MVQTIHATCVSLSGAGVLLRGPSGCGKSDLALRLIDAGALLVADDRVAIELVGGVPWGACPPALAGLLEVRGVGILPVPWVGAAPLALVVDLVPPGEVERLPGPATADVAGISLPSLRLAPFEASAPAKLRLALGARLAHIPGVPADPPPDVRQGSPST